MELEFLVDTEAGYMVLPPAIARELGLEAIMKARAILTNGTEVEADYPSAYARVLDRETLTSRAWKMLSSSANHLSYLFTDTEGSLAGLWDPKRFRC